VEQIAIDDRALDSKGVDSYLGGSSSIPDEGREILNTWTYGNVPSSLSSSSRYSNCALVISNFS